jgi:hypothetical protein
MKKIICKKEYDTETATLVKKFTYSYYGDPAGYEESLFQTPAGLYFLYVRGGEASPYPTEDILRLAKAKVNDWLILTNLATHERRLLCSLLFLDSCGMINVDPSHYLRKSQYETNCTSCLHFNAAVRLCQSAENL